VAVRESAVVAQVPGAAEQFTALRGDSGLVVQPMTEREGEIAIRDTALAVTYAPNTVGILEGTDPVLKEEYVVFSAHMDHIGTAGQPGASCRARGADSICNGADDDGSGTVGVIELAEAFSRKGARPKRSIIFLTVSGEEHGLWGSAWFTSHPPVPLRQIVADLNSDMIGRNWADTIVAIGKQHSDLGATLNRVNAVHPELHMHAIDDRWPEQNFYQRSDHYNFARKGVPILFFFNGTHADYHQATDSPDKIDAEKESRIVKLFFYVGQEVANAAQRPRWVPESYRQIVTALP
jgi:Zn-dependent M28 family amino/carboxypeptidase